MNRLKLRTYDGAALAGFLMLPGLFTTGLAKFVEQSGAAAWASLLLASLKALLLFIIASLLISRHGGRDIIDITSRVMGRPAGFLYGALLAAYFCFFTGVHIRESAEILKIYGLGRTPLYIITGLIILTGVIMNYFGGQSIAKSAGMFFLITISGVLFISILGLNRYNPDNLMPILGSGTPAILQGGLLNSSVFDSVVSLFLFAPAFSDTRSLRHAGLLSVCFVGIAHILLSVCFVMMFSPPVAQNMMSGFIEMGKSSYYSHFFYRFESILLFFLIFACALLSAIGIMAAQKSVSQITTGGDRQGIVILICAALALATAFIPTNVFELTRVYLPAARQHSTLFLFGVPLAVLAVSLIRGTAREEV